MMFDMRFDYDVVYHDGVSRDGQWLDSAGKSLPAGWYYQWYIVGYTRTSCPCGPYLTQYEAAHSAERDIDEADFWSHEGDAG